jgi:hypothetical protein
MFDEKGKQVIVTILGIASDFSFTSLQTAYNGEYPATVAKDEKNLRSSEIKSINKLKQQSKVVYTLFVDCKCNHLVHWPTF